jgi:hypothetical protein
LAVSAVSSGSTTTIPSSPLDDGHVRQVLVADLVNAVGDLEETADVD